MMVIHVSGGQVHNQRSFRTGGCIQCSPGSVGWGRNGLTVDAVLPSRTGMPSDRSVCIRPKTIFPKVTLRFFQRVISFALEAVHDAVGDTIHEAGGHDSNYLAWS